MTSFNSMMIIKKRNTLLLYMSQLAIDRYLRRNGSFVPDNAPQVRVRAASAEVFHFVLNRFRFGSVTDFLKLKLKHGGAAIRLPR